MNKDKKYYTFVYDHETLGSFPMLTFSDDNEFYDNEDYDGYYSHEELLSIESKIINFIKDENIDIKPCDIYEAITVTQYDNKEDAKSCIAHKYNWYKTYNLKKILKESWANKDK